MSMNNNNLLAQPEGYQVAEGTTPSGEYYRVIFDPNPFGAGVSRVAHLGTITSPPSLWNKKAVIKKFRDSHAYLKRDWDVDIKAASDAEALAIVFNEVSKSKTYRPIHFQEVIPLKVTANIANSLRHRASSTPVGEWVTAEHYLHGNYTKWMSNYGWVASGIGETLPAFSHWTWVYTKEKMLVCDLQGVCDNPIRGYWLTDPAIHSLCRQYGKTDLGSFGIQRFFATHRCTSICKHLGIEDVVPSFHDPSPLPFQMKHTMYHTPACGPNLCICGQGQQVGDPVKVIEGEVCHRVPAEGPPGPPKDVDPEDVGGVKGGGGSGHHGGGFAPIILVAVLIILVAVLIIAIIIFLWYYKKRQDKAKASFIRNKSHAKKKGYEIKCF